MTPQQIMIVDAFNSQTYIQDKMDIQNTPVYDTVTVAQAGSLSILSSSLFTNVGPASGKTLALTNMSQQRKLAAPEAFSVLGFRNRIVENILLADMLTILNGFCYEFFLGQKYYQRAPLWVLSAGGGIWGMFTNTTTSVLANGLPSRESMHKLAIPVVIENQMEFYAQLNGTTVTLTATASGGVGFTLVSVLDGLYARGVQ